MPIPSFLRCPVLQTGHGACSYLFDTAVWHFGCGFSPAADPFPRWSSEFVEAGLGQRFVQALIAPCANSDTRRSIGGLLGALELLLLPCFKPGVVVEAREDPTEHTEARLPT